MKRIIEPELLDELPPSDPRAIQSRRDLRRVNSFMGNVGIIERLVRRHFPQPPKRIVELGGGDGTFLLELTRRISSRNSLDLVLVDQQNLVSPETKERFQQLGCRIEVVEADVFDWLSSCEPADCMMANLFLHHFEPGKLSELLRLASEKTNVFLACEPRRARAGIVGTNLLWLIGCNAVTRHDAAVSVRAGFQENEIAALWPRDGQWKLEENKTGLFSHTFEAARIQTS